MIDSILIAARRWDDWKASIKAYGPIPLAAFQTKWPDRNIVKVMVVPCINNEDAREVVELGGTFRVFRGKKVKD